MKTLFIIRHAKSDQSFFGMDFDRPLNKRGEHDAPVMAKRLKDRQNEIDAFISSPAKRAKTTAEYFIAAYGGKASAIDLIQDLYHAPAETFYEVIAGIDNTISSAAIFAHNPGITYFVNSLNSGSAIDNMPTCGIFAVQAATDQWSHFTAAKKEFLFFDYPKLVE